MRMISDPLPKLDPDLPAVAQAVAMIRLEIETLTRECPELTPRQVEQEARRRCAKAMVDAIDQIEAARYGLRLLGGVGSSTAATGRTKRPPEAAQDGRGA